MRAKPRRAFFIMNYFTLALVFLQLLAAAQYWLQGKRDLAALFFLYALANLVLLKMGDK